MPPSVEFTWIGVIIALLAFAQRLGGWESRSVASLLAWIAGILAVGWVFVFTAPPWGWIAAAIYWHVALWFLIPAARGIAFQKATPVKPSAEKPVKTISTTAVLLPAPEPPGLSTSLLMLGPADIDVSLSAGESTGGKIAKIGTFVYSANRRTNDVEGLRIGVLSASSYDSVKQVFRAPTEFKSPVIVLNEKQLRAGFKTQLANWFLRIEGDHLEVGNTVGVGVMDWPTADPTSIQRWLLRLLLRVEGVADWQTDVFVEWEPGSIDIRFSKSADKLAAVEVRLSTVLVMYEKEGPSTPPEIQYRNKVRIAIRNDSTAPISLNSYWIANGTVSLQLPPTLAFRKEIMPGSWRDFKWGSTELPTVTLGPGEVASTWVGLFRALSDAEFGRARENREFGTLAIRVIGRDEEVHIAI